MLIQSLMKELPLVVTQRLSHASTTSGHAKLRPEDAIILQFCVALGDVTSWNIRLQNVSCTLCSWVMNVLLIMY